MIEVREEGDGSLKGEPGLGARKGDGRVRKEINGQHVDREVKKGGAGNW